MILDIDCGNSNIKWRLTNNNEVVHTGRVALSEPNFLKKIVVSRNQINTVRIASVSTNDVEQQLIKWCKTNWQIDPVFARSAYYCAGVTNGYIDPSQLGVDRWLAIIAAYNDCKSDCCVVDLGTAITVDVVEKSGKHLGGYIVPGLRSMFNMVRKNTSNIKFDENIYSTQLIFGDSSTTAVNHGIINLILGLLRQSIHEVKLNRGSFPQLYITGGDANNIAPFIDYQYIKNDDLVLDGLSFALS